MATALNSSSKSSTAGRLAYVEAGHFSVAPGMLARGPGALKSFEPSDSERHTLALGADAVLQARRDGFDAHLVVLLGDLRVPAELRNYDAGILPDVYTSAIDSVGRDRVSVTGQARYRNAGDRRIIERLRKLTATGAGEEALYKEKGFALFRNRQDGPQALYMTSDGLVDGAFRAPPLVALTHGDGRPTCPTTVAGGITEAFRNGVQSYKFYYDLADDPQVGVKLVGGAILAALAIPDIDMAVEIHLLSDTRPHDVIALDMAQVAGAGKRANTQALLDRLYRHVSSSGDSSWIMNGGPCPLGEGRVEDRLGDACPAEAPSI